MLSIRSPAYKELSRQFLGSQRLLQIGRDVALFLQFHDKVYCYYHLIPNTQKRQLQTTPPKQGIIGAIFLIGGLSWSYSYLKRVHFFQCLDLQESYIRRGMMPPPSQGLLATTMKTFLVAATLPITFPYFIYKMIKGDLRFDNFDTMNNSFNSGHHDYTASK